jgi:DNA-directed RNA polymerase subunit K/omega
MSGFSYPLTRYEKARVIAERAEQIASNDPPLVEIEPGMVDALSIARAEFDQGVLPLLVQRRYPDGRIEIITIRGEIVEST